MSPPGPFPALADRPAYDPPWFPADADNTLSISGVIGALGYALDLTEGQPPGHCLRCCWIGMHIGKAIGLDEVVLRDLYYTILPKDADCSSNAARLCELYGVDERRVKHDFKLVDTNSIRQLTSFVLSHADLQDTGLERFRRILHLAASGENLAAELVQTRCERGFSGSVAAAIYNLNLDEHWDGCGKPHGYCGAEIPVGAHRTAGSCRRSIFHNRRQNCRIATSARPLRYLAPDIVAIFESVAEIPELWEVLSHAEIERRVGELDPGSSALPLDEARLDAIASAFARVVDAKSPLTAGHSSRVAEALSMMEKIRGNAIDAQCLDASKFVVRSIPGKQVSLATLDISA